MSLTGKRLGPYEIIEEIGKGGMGTVYRARQVSLNRDVAIKVLHPNQALNPISLKRFTREATAAASIQHPNIVRVLDGGEENGLHYIVMEYVQGQTVSDILKHNGAFTYRDAVTLCSRIASVLGALHAKALIHRDVKPSNILLDKTQCPKLADFGVAALMDPSEGERLTLTLEAVGTPYYMSPEQVKARDTLTAATDVYSLGVVLYEMLAGKHPYSDATPTEVMMRLCKETFPSIRRFRPGIPPPLEAVLKTCLSMHAADRFPNGTVLHEALEKVRLHIERNPITEDRERMSGTGFFYVDPAQADKSRRTMGLQRLLMEIKAQLRDPNRRLRRQMRTLHLQMSRSKLLSNANERELRELEDRRSYHDQKANAYRQEEQEAIKTGDAERAGTLAEKESYHQGKALDYQRQATSLADRAKKHRNAYHRLKEIYSRRADELALLDADAKNSGGAVPVGETDPALSKQAQWLFAGLIMILLLTLTSAGWGLVKWLRRPRSVAVVVPAPAPPLNANSSAAHRKRRRYKPKPPPYRQHFDKNKAISFGGHQYLATTNWAKWTDAQKAAEEAGGYLAVPDSRAENIFLTHLAEETGIQYDLWLGGTDEGNSNWHGLNGRSLTNGYTNWESGHPTLSVNTEQHDSRALIMSLLSETKGKWYDFEPGDKKGYIVEIGKRGIGLDVLLHYAFSKNKNGVISDRSGHGYDARIEGDYTLETGPIGLFYEAAGNRDIRLKIPLGKLFQGKPAFTVALWVRSKKGTSLTITNPADKYPAFRLTENGKEIQVVVRGGTGKATDPFNRLDIMNTGHRNGIWHHLACVFDAGELFLYVNGQCQQEKTVYFESASQSREIFSSLFTETAVSASPHSENNAVVLSFGDALNELWIYPRVLEAAEIRELYTYRPPSVPEKTNH